MICRGCNGDLNKSADLPLSASKKGHLIITCPICKYEHFGKTSESGIIKLVGEESNDSE